MIQVRQKRERDPNAPNRFEVGDLVRHRRYDYRGLVVGFDLECQASEDWYENNRSQPKRAQPWYHVLVHGAHHATYAAQENLTDDWVHAPIEHPLVAQYFSAFTGESYVSNGRAWEFGKP